MRENEVTLKPQLQDTHSSSSSMPPLFYKPVLRQEEPLMRHVSLGPPPGTEPPPSLFQTQRQKRAPPMSESIDFELPLKNNCSSVKKSIPPPLPQVPCTNWKVSNESLKCVADRVVLERTSCFVGGTKAHVVSARISECLRSRSIEATYDNAKAKAKCKNSDFCYFRIKLFSGRGEYNHGVIVEVQHRSGSKRSFKKDCRAILNTAVGNTIEDSPLKPCPNMDLDCLREVRSTYDVSQELEIPFNLLLDDHLDANILGIECLCSMIDISVSTRDTAVRFVTNMFSNNEVLNKIFSIVQKSSLPKIISKEEETNRRLRFLTMLMLSKTFHLLKQDQSLVNALQEFPSFVDEIVPLLVDELNNAKHNPQNATIAAKNLTYLTSISTDAKNKAREGGAEMAISHANEYGIKFHSSLAIESEYCALALKCQ